MKSCKYAIFAGRWQPFHKGHLWVSERILSEYPMLILGIVNPDPQHPPDPTYHKFRPEENPFTYWERLEMLSATFSAVNLGDRVIFVPMWHPRVSLEKEQAYLPPRAEREWVVPIAEIEEYKKVEDFSALGEGVAIVEDVPEEILSYHSVSLRFLIARDDKRWRGFVPGAVLSKVVEFDGVERIRRLSSLDNIRKIARTIEWKSE